MTTSIARTFGTVALAALATLPLAGCNDPVYVIPENSSATTATVPDATVTFRQIANGGMMHELPDGSHIVTYPAKAIGTPNDLTCLVVKEKFEGNLTLPEDTATGVTYSGISCDWAGAKAPAAALRP